MEKEYAIGIDLGGTSVKYALIDNEGVFYFQGKLPSKADVSAEAVIGQLVTAINEVKAFAQEQGYKINGIGIGTPGIVDSTNRIVLGGAENINGWENIHLADRIEKETGFPALLGNDANLMGLGLYSVRLERILLRFPGSCVLHSYLLKVPVMLQAQVLQF